MTEKKTNNDTPKTDKQSDASSKAKETPHTAGTPPESSAASQPAAPAESGKGSKTGWVAIALVILLGAGLYYHGHQQNRAQLAQVTALKAELSDLKSELTKTSQDVRSEVDQRLLSASGKLEQQTNDIKGLQLAMSEVKGRRPNDWLLAEADYLTRMAGRKLWLEHDVASATVLLETADNRLAQLNDPSLTALRSAMNDDITTLKAVARIDRDGIVLRLTSLQEMVAGLPLANAIVPESLEQPQRETVSDSVSDWQSNLMTSLKQFSEHFVTYRKRDGNVIPLLSPEQNFYLQENIKSKLETAIKAVYREQGELYTQSLTMAKDWASQFYNTDDVKTQSFIKGLNEMAGQNIEASYPDKLKSPSLLADLVNQRLRQLIAPVKTEEDPA